MLGDIHCWKDVYNFSTNKSLGHISNFNPFQLFTGCQKSFLQQQELLIEAWIQQFRRKNSTAPQHQKCHNRCLQQWKLIEVFWPLPLFFPPPPLPLRSSVWFQSGRGPEMMSSSTSCRSTTCMASLTSCCARSGWAPPASCCLNSSLRRSSFHCLFFCYNSLFLYLTFLFTPLNKRGGCTAVKLRQWMNLLLTVRLRCPIQKPCVDKKTNVQLFSSSIPLSL